MGERSIPRAQDEVTAAWLTDALRSGGVIGDAAVVSVRLEAVGEGTGFIGKLARVSLAYDGPHDGAPATLISKLPTRDPLRGAMSNAARFNEREIRFYRDLAAASRVRSPRCYYTDMDLERHAYVLLLEDMAPARVGDQVAGCSPDEAELAVRGIAPLHAAWWESPRLADLGWMPRLSDVHPSVEAWWQSTWDRCVEQRGGRVPAPMLAIGERFGERAMWALRQLDAAPTTMLHGDYRLDNVFFGGAGPLAIADWQLVCKGRAIYDVALFLSGAMHPAERKAHEPRLLRAWHDTLVEHGVRGYGFERASRDYRLAMFYCLTFVMILFSFASEDHPRSLPLFETWFERCVAAIVDLDVGELLPA